MVVNGNDIITDLLSVNRFTIRYIDTPARPLLKRIEEVVYTNRLQGTATYYASQDRQSGMRSHEWAAAMYGLGGSMSILSHSTCVRILWDKHIHGRILAKHPLFTDDTTCSLCGGADSQYHIIRECQHISMRACRQKHIALLNIRRNHHRRTNNPVSALFQAYLDFASTLGEERMSHTAWTGMLAQALLYILVEANKVAGLDGARARHCLLRQINYLQLLSAIYTELATSV